MVDFRLLTFVTLCRIGNYKKTAEKLNLTQPAVTQHIQYLESYYGCKLFLYEHRTLRLTRQAELLLEYAQNLIYQEDRFTDSLSQTDFKESFRIGATKTVGEYVIGKHMSAFLKTNPNLSVTVENTEVLLKQIDDGLLDFAVIEGNFDRKKYGSRVYLSEPFLGICAENHSFSHSVVKMEDIFSQNLILREKGSGTRNIFENTIENFNFSIQNFPNVIEINSVGLITELVKYGCGITFAYQLVANQTKGLSTFEIEGMQIKHDFFYVYLNNRESEKKVRYFEKFYVGEGGAKR